MNATSVSPLGASPLLLRGLGHATRFDVRAACAGLIVSGVLVLGCGDAAGGPSVDLDGSVALPDADHEDLGSNVDLGRPQDLGADDLGMAHDAGVDMGPTLPPPPDWYEPGAPIVTEPAQLETWRYLPIAGMRCANGTDSGVFVNITDRSDDLLVFLMGGGICYDDISCNLPPHRDAILNAMGADPLAWWQGNAEGRTAIFDRNATENPLRDASYVVLPHCTLDFHLANKMSTYSGFAPLEQVGYRNVQHAISAVAPTFEHAGRVVVAGFSAGGVGTLGNYHQIAQVFESFGQPSPYLINDGGPVQTRPYYSAGSHNAVRSGWGLADTVEQWCTGCAEFGNHETWRSIHALHPGVRSAMVCAYGDQVVMGLYSLFDPLGNPQHFTTELIPFFPFVRISMRAGLIQLNTFVQGVPTQGAHRSFYYVGERHGALTAAPFSATPGLADFLSAQLNDDASWTSVIP